MKTNHNPLSPLAKALPLTLLLWLGGCGGTTDSSLPKPTTYVRIALPEKEYQWFSRKEYPYSFMYPTFAEIESVEKTTKEAYWIDIQFPSLGGTLNISYKPMTDAKLLRAYTNDCYTFVSKHFSRSNGVVEQEYRDTANGVYGVIYDIGGAAVSSPCQFFLTDSNKHFLRGALYFHCPPNNDSLQPVIDFLRKDITKLVETIRWR